MSAIRVTIAGAGAIGGWIGARLASAGHAVSFVARSHTLTALRDRGIGLQEEGETRFYPCNASDDPADLGLQDLVIIAVKAQNLPDLAPKLMPLIGPGTCIVPMLNGVPWWFMGAERQLRSVDPENAIANHLERSSLIGCVVHAAASVPQPGISALHFCDKIILGEADGGFSQRLQGLTEIFQAAGIAAKATEDIRTAIWFKLWGNMTMNPISALTLATTDRLLNDPLICELVLTAMEEARQLGQSISCPIEQSGVDRMMTTRKLGSFKTSMLQDVEAGKALELDALLAAPIEIAEAQGVDMPVIRGLFALARSMAQSRGLY